MSKIRSMIQSFNAGAWSPLLAGRNDLAKYKYACEEAVNWIMWEHGPAETTPGTKYIAEAKYGTQDSVLIPFIYSASQTYMLEFGNLYIRFFMDQAQIMDPVATTTPYEVVTPYTAANVRALQARQSGDVLYLSGANKPPMMLTRSAHDGWTLAEIEFTDGPYLAENEDNLIHLRASDVTGNNITVVAKNLHSYAQTGTWDDTPAASAALFTTALPVGGLRFQAPVDADIHTVRIEIDGAPVAPMTTRAKFYTDATGAPDTLIATSDDVIVLASGDPAYVAEQTYTFTTGSMDKDDYYWITVESDAPDDTVTVKAVVNNADYGSGSAATIAGLTDSLAYDWMVEIEYQQTGFASVFRAGHVDSIWRIRHSGSKMRKTFGALNEVSATIKVRNKFVVSFNPVTPTGGDPYFDGRVALQKSFNEVTWYDVASFYGTNKQEFFESDAGEVWYRAICKDYTEGDATLTIHQDEHWGVFKVVSYVSTHEVTANVLYDLGSTSPSPFWREGAWSDYRGHPRAIELHDNRLVFASTTHQPTHVWGSWVGDWYNHTPSDTDDSPVDEDVSEIQNAILWLKSHSGYLMVGTVGEEARITGQGDKPIGPDSFKASVQSTNGSGTNIFPVRIGPALIFAQTSKTKLREMIYSFSSDAYEAQDLSMFAEHLTASGIVQIAYQKDPRSVLWTVMANGTMNAKTYYRRNEDEVLGWSNHQTDGNYKSVAVIPSTLTGAYGVDEVWLIVERVIKGITKRYIEVMANNHGLTETKDFWCVHSGLSYDSAVAATTFTGLDHLKGETVAILADGFALNQQVVSGGGSITIERPSYKVIVGLPYTCTLKTMKLETGSADGGTSQGHKKRFNTVVFRFLKTLGGKYGSRIDNLVPFTYWREGVQVYNQQAALFTGDTLESPWPCGTDREGQIMVVQDLPLPLTLIAIIPTVEIDQ